LDSVDAYSSLDDKMAFIELNLRNFKGFLGLEYNRIDRHIIAKNKSYNGMLFMIRQFNNHFTSKFWKFHLKTYYKYQGQRISSREFKILNVANTITKK